MLGESPAFLAAIDAALRVASFAAHVLITGETGTGKGLLAQLIHANSGRTGKLVRVHCPNLHESLAESQLFGHVRGAFTGAGRNHDGFVRQAHRGTLFLDEIGDLPLGVQAMLLTALQDGVVRRIGDTQEARVDVRSVCATHCDLERMTAAGRFREDLFTRAVRYRIVMPPLRERGRDATLLARHFLAHHPSLAGVERPRLKRCAERVLQSYLWPGNVRELESVLTQAAIDAQGRPISGNSLEAAMRAVGIRRELRLVPAPPPPSASAPRTLPESKPAPPRPRRRGAPTDAELLETAKLVHPLGPAAYCLARDRGRIQRAELVAAVETSERTADRLLAGLVEAGVLEHDGGAGKAGGYRVVNFRSMSRVKKEA